MEIIKLLKENVLVIIAILMVIIVLFNLKSNFTSNVTYSEDNCYKDLRIYPSGNVPGSYLGLSRQEIDNLLPKFILNKS